MRKEIEDLIEYRQVHKREETQRYYAKANIQGKLSPRQRLSQLFDGGVFEEIGAISSSSVFNANGDGVITAFGKINGKLVYAYCQDYTLLGGSLGSVHAAKIADLQDRALKNNSPIIALIESGGARIQEGVEALNGYGKIFYRNVISSGHIPQIAIIFGACAGGASYSPALMDFIITIKDKSRMFITGPDVVKAVCGESISADNLGGSSVLNKTSGVAHFEDVDEFSAINRAKQILSYLNPRIEPVENSSLEIEDILPEEQNRGYDMHSILESVFDKDSLLEYQATWARNSITTFARLAGRSVAVVANQPIVKAGCIDIDASDKMARFIRTCSAFGLPIITFVDTPGYLPGTDQEHNGIIRHGAKLLYAYSESRTPKITVIVRKSYGGAYIAMGSKSLGADFVFAYPFSEIAVMGSEAAMRIIAKKELTTASDPKAKLQELSENYKKEIMSPYHSASRGLVDEIILPQETRERLLTSLQAISENNLSHHGNIPM